MQNDIVARQDQYLALTTGVVAAFVGNNSVPVADLPSLISKVYSAFVTMAAPVAATIENSIEKPTAVQIRRSVTPEHVVSFIDGKCYKTLKRHLGVHGLDPNSYRRCYGLPGDYPMVAPAYAARRSALAKEIGLGRVSGRASKSAAGASAATRHKAA